MKYERISQTTEKANREGYLIVVTQKKSVDGKSYQVKAVARDSKGNPVKNSTRIKFFADAKQIESKTRQVIALVNAAIPKETALARKPVVTGLDETNVMVIAYRTIAESDIEVSPTWDAEYRRTQLIYFERHILPRIQPFSDPEMPYMSSDREQLFAAIYSEVADNGHSKGNKKIMQQTVRRHLADASIIYSAMRREDPTLPVLQIEYGRTKRIQQEMLKSLPAEVRTRFAKALRERVDSEPKLAFGAILMWDAGLRTAEAAAAKYSIDIRSHDGNEGKVSMYVEWQEKDGIRCPKLKTDNGYRAVPLSFWGASLLSKCADAMPVSDAEEEHARDPPLAPLRARELSAWVKSLLIECGLTVEFLMQAEKDQSKRPDVDDQGNPIWDVTAYVLRRDRCSIWRNVCGLSQSECDYLLGHAMKRSKHEREDLRLPEAQMRLSAKLERFVADAELTDHPFYRPIPAVHGTDIDIIPFEAIRIVNASGKPLRIKLSLDAKIAGEAIFVTAPTISVAKEPHRRSKRMNGIRASEPIIGTCQIVR